MVSFSVGEKIIQVKVPHPPVLNSNKLASGLKIMSVASPLKGQFNVGVTTHVDKRMRN
jgi:hypothetical protein